MVGPGLAACATRRSTTPTFETASAARSRQTPDLFGSPVRKIPSEVAAPEAGKDWLELNREKLGMCRVIWLP
uniref:Uncharacterized protein n=1 Tax=Peronospora matthiolae TaxID=2874970 RepID=A0AAV1V114_9STRA